MELILHKPSHSRLANERLAEQDPEVNLPEDLLLKRLVVPLLDCFQLHVLLKHRLNPEMRWRFDFYFELVGSRLDHGGNFGAAGLESLGLVDGVGEVREDELVPIGLATIDGILQHLYYQIQRCLRVDVRQELLS